MKNRLLPLIVLVIVFGGLFLPAIQPSIMGAVTLPDPLVFGIQSLFVFVIGWAFAAIGNTFPWFTNVFGQYADALAYLLAGSVLGVVQNYLDMIPPLWQTPAQLFLGFLVAVLTALQVFTLLGRAKVPTFRS